MDGVYVVTFWSGRSESQYAFGSFKTEADAYIWADANLGTDHQDIEVIYVNPLNVFGDGSRTYGMVG